MRGVNKVILLGTVGKDAEVRSMPNGNTVASLSLATSDSWKDKQTGQVQERTEWHKVVFFGKLAEIAGNYAKKGTQLYIEGRLQTRKWQDQSGADRYVTEIVVDQNGQMQLIGGRRETGNASAQPAAPVANQARPQASNSRDQARAPVRPAAAPAPDYDSFDDNIPF